jgi:hypothetical protein
MGRSGEDTTPDHCGLCQHGGILTAVSQRIEGLAVLSVGARGFEPPTS